MKTSGFLRVFQNQNQRFFDFKILKKQEMEVLKKSHTTPTLVEDVSFLCHSSLSFQVLIWTIVRFALASFMKEIVIYGSFRAGTKCSPLYYITQTHTNTHIHNLDIHVTAISSHLTIFSLWQNFNSKQDCSWNSYKKDLTFPISIPTHMIILGKHKTTGNLVIYPAEEALNKQGSKKDFCYTLITSSHRLGMYRLH